ncbi:MAG TPA: alpha/beta hydrolase [Gallionellaceae bacterium]|nr:alpha/beta hydrolase [Gallionellaceae bacterium]
MIRISVGRAVAILIVLMLAGLYALVDFNYQRDMTQARERISVGSKLAQTPCGQIEYADAGKGSPVLLVHGAGSGYDQTQDASKVLVKSGFRVIAMSRFGYLRTPLPADASAAAQADAHACLLDALHIRRAAIVGASAGAPSSMQFALRYPERTTALVLLVPVSYAPRPDGAPTMYTPPGFELFFDTALQSDFLLWAVPRLASQTVISGILATPPAVVENASAAERARVEQVLSNILPVGPRRLGLLNDAAIAASLPRYELEHISAPTLILSVADDLFRTYDGARYSADHIPRARFISYPSGGHLCVGHQEEVMSEIANFLK